VHNIELNKYKTFIFDCDGVVLNSNNIKTDAFYTVSKRYGLHYAKKLVEYHIDNGGISRYKKFSYFIKNILEKDIQKSELNTLLRQFSNEVKKSLLKCNVANGLEELRNRTRQAKWLIVSGGDQSEIREVFQARGIYKYFDGGIFGSPDNKNIILGREIENGRIQKLALFLGDSKYDYQCAIKAKLEFLFITNWTDVTSWNEWVNTNKIQHVNSLDDLNMM
jgi:phosphoglycolate phosphatase-like HAD superfamily hydrolase